MKLEREVALIEAILFLESEPIEIENLSRYAGLPRDVVEHALEQLQVEYAKEEHGIHPIEISNGVQFSPKEELWEYLKERYGKKNENRLSKAALETLSIIAYSQPITRGEVDNIRGVSSSNMIKQLAERELVKVVGKKDVPGKPVQYGTTREFLKLFRLKSIADLPDLNDLDKERFELEADETGK
ncbi:MAG TPA: SMC-Scp complex subunit ScpB [Sediminispirochaeta sp.]|nr:SMC-Scp complex subunit ScpB [Sediminispirochaeta sp.]